MGEPTATTPQEKKWPTDFVALTGNHDPPPSGNHDPILFSIKALKVIAVATVLNSALIAAIALGAYLLGRNSVVPEYQTGKTQSGQSLPQRSAQ